MADEKKKTGEIGGACGIEGCEGEATRELPHEGVNEFVCERHFRDPKADTAAEAKPEPAEPAPTEPTATSSAASTETRSGKRKRSETEAT